MQIPIIESCFYFQCADLIFQNIAMDFDTLDATQAIDHDDFDDETDEDLSVSQRKPVSHF